MQVVLDAADEIKLSNQSIDYIRDVLASPKETLIKMQMQVATRLKDHARCIRITIKLKDLMFNQTKVRSRLLSLCLSLTRRTPLHRTRTCSRSRTMVA